jgi:hypothetical protein
MSFAPESPAEYGDEDWPSVEAVAADDYATGLDVWEPVTKAYRNFLGDSGLANAQLWSLREAIRAELLAESTQAPSGAGG